MVYQSQKQLAEKIGVSQSHISEMEKGKRPIGKKMARMTCRGS
ncbi:MAG: helix-turn-helix transcriptional regulator [Deltaproteobacteria bacterium]|nr:helix-turn-helix transcriptional regulator [Deltaproteobacteria bacterium]